MVVPVERHGFEPQLIFAKRKWTVMSVVALFAMHLLCSSLQ